MRYCFNLCSLSRPELVWFNPNQPCSQICGSSLPPPSKKKERRKNKKKSMTPPTSLPRPRLGPGLGLDLWVLCKEVQGPGQRHRGGILRIQATLGLRSNREPSRGSFGGIRGHPSLAPLLACSRGINLQVLYLGIPFSGFGHQETTSWMVRTSKPTKIQNHPPTHPPTHPPKIGSLQFPATQEASFKRRARPAGGVPESPVE